ncbi:transposase [Pyramidobacter piscolens]|uniref:transposase n=1 Tax=Pyramidobacter piscolens TaxID=638849 RepID=UPI002AB12FC9|nr:transposase [Pyramidobacter piscolens]
MIVNKLFEIVPDKANRRWLYALAAVVVAALLAAWYWHSYAGHGETDAVISRLRESAATAERRADAIVDATRQREVTARAQAKKRTDDLPADRLAAALDALLAEYRAGR